MDTGKQILDKIEEMYNLKDADGKQKNKAFFSHLIRAYVPHNSVSVALKNPESKKSRVRCVFTKKPLVTAEGITKEMNSSAFDKNFDAFVKSFDKDKVCFMSSTPMDQLLKGKTLGLQGKKTETFMSQESYTVFINWVNDKYLSGDPHIKWLLGKMSNIRLNPLIKIATKKKKSNKPSVYSTDNKKATFGDLSQLQALKEKLEGNDNDN
jgi:hypothetical protein